MKLTKFFDFFCRIIFGTIGDLMIVSYEEPATGRSDTATLKTLVESLANDRHSTVEDVVWLAYTAYRVRQEMNGFYGNTGFTKRNFYEILVWYIFEYRHVNITKMTRYTNKRYTDYISVDYFYHNSAEITDNNVDDENNSDDDTDNNYNSDVDTNTDDNTDDNYDSDTGLDIDSDMYFDGYYSY